MRLCKKCNIEKDIREFYSHPRARHTCKECEREYNLTRWRGLSNDQKRSRSLRRFHGMTLEDFEILASQQSNRCAICGIQFLVAAEAVVDHDHDTGEVRGLLCSLCNKGIGCLQDRVDIIEKALEYLRRHSSVW